MPFERRLAASLILLLGIVPVMGAFLPVRPEALVAPLAVLVCTAATVVALRQRVAAVAASGLGALAMVAFTAWAATSTSLGYTAIVPFALALAGAPTLGCVGGLAAAIGLALLLGEPPTRGVVTVATLTDVVGVIALLGWTGWIVGRGVRVTWMRRDLDELISMAENLGAGISRDAAQLWAIARHLADSQRTEVRGQGLDEDRLQMATALEDGTLVVAHIEGDPLATLTVGYALRACAAAGVTDPEALREIAATQLDEVNEPDDLQWIAVFDPGSQAWRSSPADLCQRRLRQGRLHFERRLDRRHTRTALTQRLSVEAMPDVVGHARVAIEVGLAAALTPASALTTALGPHVGALPLFAVAVSHALVHWRRQAAAATYDACEAAVDDRIDCRDNVHHGLARLLGGLLPYQVSKATAVATAHRLRGDVISGSFADMMVDEGGKLRILAGEVAGEGIGAGFLSVAAQMTARNLVSGSRLDWDAVVGRTESLVRREAAVLKYPLQLELGLAEVDGLSVKSYGFLDRLVVFRPEARKAQLVEQVELSPHVRVYVTPGTSRAGPEDDAPTVDRSAIAGRLADVLGRGDTDDERELPSLFSEVFDGSYAPAHGTLIELRLDEQATSAASLAGSSIGAALGDLLGDPPSAGTEAHSTELPTQDFEATVVDRSDPVLRGDAAA